MRPSAASDFMRLRIHKMPSGSRPLMGSSNITVWGSPSRAAAMPRRWLIPSEKVPTRLPATSLSPTMSSTWLTRWRAMPLLSANHLRWLAALRPPTMALASSSAPDRSERVGQLSIGFAVDED